MQYLHTENRYLGGMFECPSLSLLSVLLITHRTRQPTTKTATATTAVMFVFYWFAYFLGSESESWRKVLELRCSEV